MVTEYWLKHHFTFGYSSGDILRWFPDATRQGEERAIGGSYRRCFFQAVRPYLRRNANILELGPGRGSWTRAILRYLPGGTVQTVDYQDVTAWLKPEQYKGRLRCHQVQDNSFDAIADGSIDFFFSFGVLCHHPIDQIEQILTNALPKMKPNGFSVHQYADWQKLDTLGWRPQYGAPRSLQTLPDDHEDNFWPRNHPQAMGLAAQAAGWQVRCADLNLFKRDSLILLQAPPGIASEIRQAS